MDSLIRAIDWGDVEKVKNCVFEEGKSNDQTILLWGRTILDYAFEKGSGDIVRVLVTKFKPDLNIRIKKDGSTRLHHACWLGHPEVARVLVKEFKADLNVKDIQGHTPLHSACTNGHADVAKVLVAEFKADLTAQDNVGHTPLHSACTNGHLGVVRVLVSKFNASLTAQDNIGHTPLHSACSRGKLEIARALVSEFQADLSLQDQKGHTPLHTACENGYYWIASELASKFNADLRRQDKKGRTPLHIACDKQYRYYGLRDSEFVPLIADVSTPDNKGRTPLHIACKRGCSLIITILVSEFNADLSALDKKGRTPLHCACRKGHLDVAKLVSSEFRVDIKKRDAAGCTPLMLAARGRSEDTVLSLLRDYQCPVTDRDNKGWGVLHHACAGGSVSLVKVLVNNYHADVDHCDQEMNTPLQVALNHIPDQSKYFCRYPDNFGVACCLIFDFGCDANAADKHGRTILHYACQMNEIALVHKLIHDHKADTNHCDKEMNTPLQAALNNHVYWWQRDHNMVHKQGPTLLYWACEMGEQTVAHTLVHTYGVDVNIRDDQMNTPLHVAVRFRKYNVVEVLVNESGCDPSARDYLGRTPLHLASKGGHHKIVQELLKFTSPLVTDEDGNTPLHLASEHHTAQCLLDAKAPVLIRNAKGQTPIDLAKSTHVRELLRDYAKENVQADYEELSKCAKKKYSGSHYITRVFVLGYPGAGKSSFIESLKREGFFQSFGKVSESSVPPHTAGIIPSVHMSKQYGRVLFYDFAGDAEYYSSHAAIFESLALSRKGSNIFVVVVDLREDDTTLENTLHYWFSFIQYQKFRHASFLVVGSHLDQSVELSACLGQFCGKVQPKVKNIEHFMLDCRDPRSNPIALFKKQVNTWVSQSQKYNISNEAGLLLGLLEKDFSAVTACPVQTLVSHIKESGVWLPVEPKPLHQILLELHEVGVLLLLGDCTRDSDHVVLNISKLTNEVHESLFATSTSRKGTEKLKAASFKIGILPEGFLNELLPPYITIECLTHLQYCQKIDMGLFPSLKQDDSTSQSFLFFPALCSVDKSQVSWDESTGNSFSIGWLALCTDPHDYFPSRFLHVLLLRLVYGFTLSSARQKTANASPAHSRRCTMWKNGVHWLMEEGVDCMVELVNASKGVVVLTKSSMDGADDCVRILTKVVSCVMEVKTEFCHSIKPEFFLLDSSAEADYLNEDHQFAVSDVERALESPEGKRVIISVSGRGKVELSKILSLKQFTLWNTFFPFEAEKVLRTLRVIVHEISDLGLVLGVPQEILESLKVDFPSDVTKRRTELVSWWMKNSPKPTCWYTLVAALEDIERSTLAGELRNEHGLHLQLQEKLLGEPSEALKPDAAFLHSFSGVVGSRWPSLAVSLALNEEEIEELKEKVGLSQQELSLQMLKIWASREEATYGSLYHTLKSISLFHY